MYHKTEKAVSPRHVKHSINFNSIFFRIVIWTSSCGIKGSALEISSLCLNLSHYYSYLPWKKEMSLL